MSVCRFVKGNVCRKYARYFCLVDIKKRSFWTACVFWFIFLNARYPMVRHLCFRFLLLLHSYCVLPCSCTTDFNVHIEATCLFSLASWPHRDDPLSSNETMAVIGWMLAECHRHVGWAPNAAVFTLLSTPSAAWRKWYMVTKNRKQRWLLAFKETNQNTQEVNN